MCLQSSQTAVGDIKPSIADYPDAFLAVFVVCTGDPIKELREFTRPERPPHPQLLSRVGRGEPNFVGFRETE